MLQPVRAGVTGALGQRPTVLAPQIRHQPQHQRPGIAQRLAPNKPRRDTIKDFVKPCTPTIKIYAMSRGGRG